MTTEAAAMFLRQHEIAWKLASHHFAGLTNEACLWRPSSKGLHVTSTAYGTWRGEWPDHEGYALGPPSMAWLLWHMTYWWSMVVDHSFGDATLDQNSVDCPADVELIVAGLQGLHERWVDQVARLDGEDLHSAQRSRWPFTDRPFADVVGWVNIELTKNAAELGYARFLHAVRP